GIAISASMKNIRFLPTLVTSIVGVGEAVGDLPAMLVRLADYYDREIIYAVEAVLTMIEPIMIGVMGSIVCFVILSVFLPLYQVVMNMGH
ncbi:MAG: type II secretion system F family protein, partial [Candidatus Xenobia bacterium]